MNSLKEINWEWERPSLTITETWCHYTAECDLLCCVLCVLSCSVVASLRPRGPTRLLCPWGFPSKNTRVDSHSLLHGIFPTQGSNPGLLHCRWDFHSLSHQGSLVYSVSSVKYSKSLQMSLQVVNFQRCEHGPVCQLSHCTSMLFQDTTL